MSVIFTNIDKVNYLMLKTDFLKVKQEPVTCFTLVLR